MKSLKSKGSRTAVSSALALFLALALPACGSAQPPDGAVSSAGQGVGLKRIGNFESPVYVTGAPGFPHLLFVVEQGGTVQVLRNGHKQAQPFLDIHGLISSGGERGLLSIASPPTTRAAGASTSTRPIPRATSGSTNSNARARRKPRGAPVAQ